MNNHIAEHDELILEVKNLKKFYKAKNNSHFSEKKRILKLSEGLIYRYIKAKLSESSVNQGVANPL